MDRESFASDDDRATDPGSPGLPNVPLPPPVSLAPEPGEWIPLPDLPMDIPLPQLLPDDYPPDDPMRPRAPAVAPRTAWRAVVAVATFCVFGHTKRLRRSQPVPVWILVAAVWAVGVGWFTMPAPDADRVQWGYHRGALLLPPPASPEEQSMAWWRMLTCLLVHNSWPQLLLGITALFTFGPLLECLRGTPATVLVYVIGGWMASLSAVVTATVHPQWSHRRPPQVLTGTNGAACAVAGAYLADALCNRRPAQLTRVHGCRLGVLLACTVASAWRDQTDDGWLAMVPCASGLVFGLLLAVRCLPGVSAVPVRGSMRVVVGAAAMWYAIVQPIALVSWWNMTPYRTL